MTEIASLRQDSLRRDSLKHRLAYRAPGFERSCAQNGCKNHWLTCAHWGKSAWALGKNLLKITWSLEFNFHSLGGQLDSNPVYDEFNNRHFEIHQYTNCVSNHNLKTFNYCFSIYISMNYLIKMWKVGNKNRIKVSNVKLITFLTRWL